MKRVIFSLLALCIIATKTGAQDIKDSVKVADSQAVTDTAEMSSELEALTIKASPVTHKVDRDLYTPTSQARELSKNGLSLLNNMLIPSVSVNTVLNTIKANGSDVQLRINGRVATIQQVKAITPESVLRVEYHDNPGLRYGGAATVIDFIVRNPLAGGSFMADAMQVVKGQMGNYNADLKLNNGRSQFSANMNMQARANISMFREYKEHYLYPDGSEKTRTETPLEGSKFSNAGYYPYVSYNYIIPDTTVLYVGAGMSYNHPVSSRMRGKMSIDDGSNDILLDDNSKNPNTGPWFEAYLEQHIGKRQILVADAKFSANIGESKRLYSEEDAVTESSLVDVKNRIKNRNYAIGLTANYIKEWNKSKLTTGASYTANRNCLKYKDLNNDVFHQRQDKAYFFAEYLQQIGKISLTVGFGGAYTDINYKESHDGKHDFTYQPRLNVHYKINNRSQLLFSFKSWTENPTLDQTNPVLQQIDGVQYQQGKAGLKPYTTYQAFLRYSFNFNRFNGKLTAGWTRSINAIALNSAWQPDGKFLRTYANNGYYTSWWVSLNPQIEVVPNWFMLSGSAMLSRDYFNTPLYRHSTKVLLNGDVTASLFHWGFGLMAQYQRGGTILGDEVAKRGETTTIIALQYTWRNFSFGAGMLMPFGKYSQEEKNLNKYISSHTIVRTDFLERTAFIQIGYNLSWGRQRRGVEKLTSSDASAQSSSAAGR